MDEYLKKAKTWFEERNLREKLLVCGLSWAIIYSLFAIFLYHPLDTQSKTISTSIKKTNDKIDNWKTQLDYLKTIPNTALYKEWVTHNKSYESLKQTYKDILGKPISEQWKEITNTVLRNHPNITIDEIRNIPESVYQPGKTKSSPGAGAIYQQQMRVTIYGNFQDIVQYLQILENGLPNIYWNTLNYEVVEYPLARVSMEFSVLYEKFS